MRNKRVQMLAEIGVAIALSAVANLIPLWKMPQGGSVSLEMLPILIIAFRWGGGPGMIAGFVYGLVNLAVDPYIIHPVQLLMDYPLPYMMVGLAGFIKIKDYQKLWVPVITGTIIGGIGRFIIHLLSGAIFFGQYAPEGQNPWIYSAIYNGSYIIPSLIVSIILVIPLLKTLPKNQ